MLSLPIGTIARPDDSEPLGESLRRSGWFEAGIVLFLLFILTYVTVMNVMAREKGKYVLKQAGEQYIDPNTDEIYKDTVKVMKVPADEAHKYIIRRIYRPKPENDMAQRMEQQQEFPETKNNGQPIIIVRSADNIPDDKVDNQTTVINIAEPDIRWFSRRAQQETDVFTPVRAGMTKKDVLKIWGSPTARKDVFVSGRKHERWTYGDPVLDLGAQTRYVDFAQNGVAVLVHDTYTGP